jgi:hypothetical protein
MLAGVLQNIDKQILATEQQILAKERWEQIEEAREDTLAEAGMYYMQIFGYEILGGSVL